MGRYQRQVDEEQNFGASQADHERELAHVSDLTMRECPTADRVLAALVNG